MDGKIAAALLASMLERAGRDQTLGSVSALEQDALRFAVQAMGGSSANATPVVQPPAPQPVAPVQLIQSTAAAAINAEPITRRTKVKLVLDSIERKPEPVPGVLMCLDFGTAMSKAFAFTKRVPSPRREGFEPHLELVLGEADGHKGHAIPSSVFIADNGKVWFGFQALSISEGQGSSEHDRIDSIKDWISFHSEGLQDIESKLLSRSQNPTNVKLTRADLLRTYLAYLTDISERALEKQVPGSRYVRRRYARPCWPDEKRNWRHKFMARALADAQILADTFSGKWADGIDASDLKDAIEQIKTLTHTPEYLIGEGVPESVAVAAGAIAESENLRDAYMVVDSGAGTTDFGLFIAVRRPEEEDFRVLQILQSLHSLTQAGNRVDSLLKGFIAHRESIDPRDTTGALIWSDLTRRIRSLKETIFTAGELTYTLADGTIGTVMEDEFLADKNVRKFSDNVARDFTKALEGVDASWLEWLASERMRLHVILTGGSSSLPMMQALGSGSIEVKGHLILRERITTQPNWLPDELTVLYPQLAVAIGGVEEAMPETTNGPLEFMGGTRAPTYVAGGTHRDA